MPDSSTLSIVSGVSTALGLAALAMLWFYRLEQQKLQQEAADSIAEDLEGPAKFKAPDLLKIILSFKDEEKRIRAIEALTKYDERKARIFSRAAEQKQPVKRLRATDRRSSVTLLAFAVFLSLGIAGHLASRLIRDNPTETGVETPHGAASSTAPAASSTTSNAPSALPAPSSVERRTLEFTSGPKNSGQGKNFSDFYEVCSDIPSGFKIETESFRLIGDRACGEYSKCMKTVDLPTKVCYSFSLQGHDESLENGGVRQSTGILTVLASKW